MDVQTCALYLASYAFTTDDIVYHWRHGIPVEYHPMLNTSLPNFSLEPVETARCSSSTTTGEYSCIQAIFTMKRMFSYYLAQVYVPSTLLVVVSWVSFWLDRSAVPARITLGVTTLLTMTTQAASINNSLPAVSYIKAVDVWIGGCLAFIFATVLEYAYVSYRASMIKCEKETAHEKRCPAACQVADPKKSTSSPRKDSRGADKFEQQALLKEKTAELENAPFGLGWWQKWKYGADLPKMIDLRSRIIFPVLFLVFNVAYWTWCSTL
ncbi:Neurotransmitter-gated ion-channel transmembrane region [Oesophagostomum dentatum]|uniref:Neurotransmitter-gated ion-channel transmembrane region n=1 Tax=Oesophagostomum dentatum TaxID=61180 RepID=A0A0B1TBI6_OESDE|nr:Neurotransmitter-gated ion-channel transmembrane region [Oesophagostomum dentatum]